MTGFPAPPRFARLTAAILATLLSCSAASADLITPPASLADPVSGLEMNNIDMLAGISGGLDFTSPEAIALTNYWFSLVSDPWNNYTLIVDLFGPGAAAVLLADETAAPLLTPGASSGSGNAISATSQINLALGAAPLVTSLLTSPVTSPPASPVTSLDSAPEPATFWLAGLGVVAVIFNRLRQRSAEPPA